MNVSDIDQKCQAREECQWVLLVTDNLLSTHHPPRFGKRPYFSRIFFSAPFPNAVYTITINLGKKGLKDNDNYITLSIDFN